MGSKASKRKKDDDDFPSETLDDIDSSVKIHKKEKKGTVTRLTNTNLYRLPQHSVSTKHPYNLRELAEIIMFGFVRIHCFIALEKTPQDVIDLCLLFYTVGDEWDTNTSDSRLVHDEGQIVISKPEDCHTINRYYAFGKDTCNRGQTYIWTFKVAAKDSTYSRISISIGIIERKLINQKSFDIKYNNDYLYDTNRYKLMLRNGVISDGNNCRNYCAPANVGDVIEMELNLTKTYGELSFVINSISHGVAYDNIPVKGKYAICVAFQRRDKLQIVPQFKKTKIL